MSKKLYSRALLPNTEGFEFIAFMRDRTLKGDIVKKRPDGLHYCHSGEDLVGWIPACREENGNKGSYIGVRVWFEDEQYQRYGNIFYIPSKKEQEWFKEIHGELCISIMPEGSNRAKFVPVSQILLDQPGKD